MTECCCICLEHLNQQEGNFLRIKCKHEFHFNCIFQLLATNSQYNNKCPMCRNNIIDINQDINIKNNQNNLHDLISEIHYLQSENNNQNIKLLKLLFISILILCLSVLILHSNVFLFIHQISYMILNLFINFFYSLAYKIIFFIFIPIIFLSVVPIY